MINHRKLIQTLLFIFFSSSIFLSGCTQKYQDTIATFKEALHNQKEIDITPEQIKALPYASAFVTVNEEKKIFIVLAFNDVDIKSGTPVLKWLSADKGLIATHNGRIIKTLGFSKDNLAGLSSNYLNIPPPSDRPISWQAVYDWMPGYRYNFTATVSSKYLGKKVISSPLWSKETRHIEETVSFTSLHSEFKNEFWLDDKGEVVKTIQYLGPNMDRVEMLFLKPYISTPPHQ